MSICSIKLFILTIKRLKIVWDYAQILLTDSVNCSALLTTPLETNLLSAHRWRRGCVRRGPPAPNSSHRTFSSEFQCSDLLPWHTGCPPLPLAAAALLKQHTRIKHQRACSHTSQTRFRWSRRGNKLLIELKVISDERHATHLGNLPSISINLEYTRWSARLQAETVATD